MKTIRATSNRRAVIVTNGTRNVYVKVSSVKGLAQALSDYAAIGYTIEG